MSTCYYLLSDEMHQCIHIATSSMGSLGGSMADSISMFFGAVFSIGWKL